MTTTTLPARNNETAYVVIACLEVDAKEMHAAGKLPMLSSAELNLSDARKAIAAGNDDARDASIVHAARFVYGILDARHTRIVAVFGR